MLDVPLRQSCPSGFTKADLEYIFTPEELKKFWNWMTGQTVSLCNGEKYHHIRQHNDQCGHADNEPEYTWKCSYPGGGHSEPSECAGNPHGPVFYRWDVERYVEGGFAKEIFD